MTVEADLPEPAFVLLVDGRFEAIATCQVTSRYLGIAPPDWRFIISMQCKLFPVAEV